MTKRLLRIKQLFRIDKRCTAMIWIGARPQGTWGHQGNGLAPTTVKRLRQQFSSAAMLRRPSGCTTSAFALNVGIEKDPTISLRTKTFSSWFDILKAPGGAEPSITRTWEQLASNLAGPSRWQRVQGPMAAVVATLYDLGWSPHEPAKWTDPSGTMWEFDPQGPGVKVKVQDLVTKYIEKSLWQRASEHYCGKGLENGADLTIAKRMRAKLLKNGDAKTTGLLDMFIQGSGWPPARRAAAGMPVEATCTFCKEAAGTLLHQLWECPVILHDIGDGARDPGRHLEGSERRGAFSDDQMCWQSGVPPPGCEAFWNRGLLPPATSLGLLVEPPARSTVVWRGCAGGHVAA